MLLRSDQLPRPALVEEAFVATRDDYLRVIANAHERIRDWPGLQRVLQFGHVKSPGISDVDLMLVFDDDVDWQKIPSEDFQDAFPQPYFLHLPFAIQQSCLDRVTDLFYIDRLVDLATGRDIRLSRPHDDAVLSWNYGAALTMVRALTRELGGPRLRARAVLCFLGAVRYNIELVAGRIEHPSFEPFRHLVDQLRTHWEPDRPGNLDLLLDAIHEALEVLMHILSGYEALIPELIPGAPTQSCQVALAPFDLVIRYGDSPAGVSLQRDPFTKLRRTIVDLPAPCAALHVWRLSQLPQLDGGVPAVVEPRAADELLSAATPHTELAKSSRQVAQTELEYARFMADCPLPFQYLSPGAAFDRRRPTIRQRLGRFARRVVFSHSA